MGLSHTYAGQGRLPYYLRLADSNVSLHLTRARLFNHHLKSETGSWAQHSLPLNERLCSACLVYEDIVHVLTCCPKYNVLKVKYKLDYFSYTKDAMFDVL